MPVLSITVQYCPFFFNIVRYFPVLSSTLQYCPVFYHNSDLFNDLVSCYDCRLSVMNKRMNDFYVLLEKYWDGKRKVLGENEGPRPLYSQQSPLCSHRAVYIIILVQVWLSLSYWRQRVCFLGDSVILNAFSVKVKKRKQAKKVCECVKIDGNSKRSS
jgi:hypothetical protein